MRRPHLVRVRSLLKLMTGLKTVVSRLGTLDIVSAMSMLVAPSSLNLIGMMLGITCSIRVKQKSPHSSHAKSATSPPLVYVREPTFQVCGVVFTLRTNFCGGSHAGTANLPESAQVRL